nr:putative cytochrome C oxidase-like subunit III [Ipomoea batatas]
MASFSSENDSGRKCKMVPAIAHLLFTVSNTMVIMFRAYVNRQYSLLAFIFFMYSAFFLLDYFSFVYHRLSLSADQKSQRYKDMLGLAIWFLFSAMMFGLVYQLGPLFPFSFALFLYAIVGAGSCILFYLYMIFDDRGDCRFDHKKFEEQGWLSKQHWRLFQHSHVNTEVQTVWPRKSGTLKLNIVFKPGAGSSAVIVVKS